MNRIDNPSIYRKLSQPFDSNKAIGAAIDAFFADVRAAREKHRIADVVVLAMGDYLEGDKEISTIFSFHNGDSAKVLPILAQAYGAARKEHEVLIDRLASSSEE